MTKALARLVCAVIGHSRGIQLWDTSTGHLVYCCTRFRVGCGCMKTIAVATHVRIEKVG